MVFLFLLFLATPTTPQYSSGGVSSQAAAPSNPTTQVSCWTEQATVWDTQYVETESQECQTVQMMQCNTLYQEQCVPTMKQECRMVPDQECTKVPYQDCQPVAQEQCNQVHKKVPQRVSKSVGKKVCDDGGSYGTVQGSRVSTARKEKPQLRLRSSDAVNFGR